MINFEDNTIDLDYFRKIIREIKNNEHDNKDEIIDSFSDSQFQSKREVFKTLKRFDILHRKPVIMIWGSWFASIIAPMLCEYAKTIIVIDIDKKATDMCTRLHNIDNLDIRTADAFNESFASLGEADLIINTSGEHMPPMTEYLYLRSVKPGAMFLIQSNNMYGIEGHTNCSETIEDFKKQIPEEIKIIFESTIPIREYERYTLVGIKQ